MIREGEGEAVVHEEEEKERTEGLEAFEKAGVPVPVVWPGEAYGGGGLGLKKPWFGMEG